MIGAYEISLLTTVGIAVTFALSLNLVTGFCGQISLGHAAFLGTGAYVAAVSVAAGLPVAAGLAAGGIVAAPVGGELARAPGGDRGGAHVDDSEGVGDLKNKLIDKHIKNSI